MPTVAPSPRTQVRRKAERAHYDRATLDAIVDQAFVCHVAFNDGGSVHCLPTACWRGGDHLYIHGAANSRLMQAVLTQVCAVTITHLDGLVLARSAFHHSMNYRSVVIYGRFDEVGDADAKARAFSDFIEHVAPGRMVQVRAPSSAELSGTRLARIALHEAAAKVRNWGVEDAASDLSIPVWAGVVPLHLHAGPLQPDAGSDVFPAPVQPAWLGEDAPRRS